MTGFRNFPDDREALARIWRQEVLTGDDWIERPDLGILSSAANPFWVSGPATVGVAKPGLAKVQVSKNPFAAFEKITADLAYDLGLPIPPVILWDRDQVPSGQERFAAISAIPFRGVRTWGEIRSDDILMNMIRDNMQEEMLRTVAGWKKIPETYFRTLAAEDVARVHQEISPADKLARRRSQKERESNRGKPRGRL